MNFGLVFDKFTERFRSIAYGYNVWAGNYRPLEIDPINWGLHVIDSEHHEIHEGTHYFVSGYVDLATDDVLDMTFLMPNSDRWVHWTWHIDVENTTNWLVYENAIQTNALANVMTPFNSNRNSARVSGTVLRYEHQADLAAANVDTNVATATLLESGIAGANKTVGDDVREHELILKQGTLYCLRAIATTAGYIDFKMYWYEHRQFAH